jgi:short-subunit dehydrogenase
LTVDPERQILSTEKRGGERKMVTRQRHGPWALIVGGSEGIGEALADILGAQGIHLVLVSRTAEPLEATANRMRHAYGITVRTLSLDVSRADTLERIREQTDDVEIGLLVHNVGGGGGGPFMAREIDDLLRGVMVNCVNLVKLVHHYGRPMAARGSGGIVMFGSMAGNIGSPNIATYGAGKAFVQNLCEALWAELEAQGVDVLDVVIGSADTPARRRSGVADHEKFPVVSAEAVARLALDRIGDGPVLVPPGYDALFAQYSGMMPRREAALFSRKMLAEMSMMR